MTKMVKVSYSFYKKYFRECKTGEYDEKRKTIEIEFPKRRSRKNGKQMVGIGTPRMASKSIHTAAATKKAT